MSYGNDEVNHFYSKKLTIATYVVAVLIPILSILLWFLVDKKHINLGISDNYTFNDFLITGFIIGYFFLYILSTIDIIQKFRAKIVLDTVVNKNGLDMPYIDNARKIFWIVGAFSIAAVALLILGFLSSKLNILMYKPYKRTVAPPGVGPGIAEAHTFDYS